LTELIYALNDDEIVKIKTVLEIIQDNQIIELNMIDLNSFITDNSILLTESELLSLIGILADLDESQSILLINIELVQRALNRINQYITFFNMKNSEVEHEKLLCSLLEKNERELLTFLQDEEKKYIPEYPLTLKNTVNHANLYIDSMVKNYNELLYSKSTTPEEETNLKENLLFEIDDIKAKFKESEFYIKELENKSEVKTYLIESIKNMSLNQEKKIKYYEEYDESSKTKNLFRKQTFDEQTVIINKQIDDINKLNDLINIKRNECDETRNLLIQKDTIINQLNDKINIMTTDNQ